MGLTRLVALKWKIYSVVLPNVCAAGTCRNEEMNKQPLWMLK